MGHSCITRVDNIGPDIELYSYLCDQAHRLRPYVNIEYYNTFRYMAHIPLYLLICLTMVLISLFYLLFSRPHHQLPTYENGTRECSYLHRLGTKLNQTVETVLSLSLGHLNQRRIQDFRSEGCDNVKLSV